MDVAHYVNSMNDHSARDIAIATSKGWGGRQKRVCYIDPDSTAMLYCYELQNGSPAAYNTETNGDPVFSLRWQCIGQMI